MVLLGIHVKYISKIFSGKVDSIYTLVDSISEHSFPHFLLSLGTLILCIIYLFDTYKGVDYNNFHFWLPIYSNIFTFIISALFKFMIHCQFVSLAQFSTRKFDCFCVIKCYLFMHSLFTHSINVFSICFVSSTVRCWRYNSKQSRHGCCLAELPV